METHSRPDRDDPEAYLASKGIQLRRAGTNQLRFDCPFCNPPDTGRHCYMDAGSGQYLCHKCGAKGNLRTLQRHFGDVVELTPDREPALSERTRILQAAVDCCAGRLDLELTEVLGKRGITSETADRFRVGYDDGTLAQYLIREQGLTAEQLHEVGLTNGDGNDSLYRRLTFPTIVQGRVVHLSGRSIDHGNDLRWQHIKGPIDHVFNEDSLASPEVIVTEGAFDCLTASQWGYAAVCMFGTGAAVGKLAERLKPAERVYICFDSDDAGRRAARELADILGPRARIVQLPGFDLASGQRGKDLNDFLVSGATKEDFGKLLESAPTLAELLINEIPEDIDPVRLSEKLEPALRQLARCSDSEARAILKFRVKDRFGLDARMIDSLMTDVRRLRKEIEREAAHALGEHDEDGADDSPPDLTPAEIEQAEALLKAPDLIDQISRDVRALGVVGEEKTGLLLYLAMTSRKSPKPISVELRGHSGAGKSFLVQTILSMMPESEVVSHTRVTPRYLEHLSQGYLKHKVLVISEAAGGEGAELAVRMMADDTSARIDLGYVKENPKTGEHESVTKIVEGPMCLIQTSTRTGANPEDESRWWILEADDSADQRKRIQKAILSTALPQKGIPPARKASILGRHRNLQRILVPHEVAIPYAELIQFPTDLYRSNRDLKRFLSVVCASALLHQHQRRRVTIDGREVLVADVRDYEVAYDVCVGAVVGSRHSLPARSRELLAAAEQLLKAKREIGDPDPNVTRSELAELPDWDEHRILRAVKPLETRGYFEFKSGTKPYRYRIGRTAPPEANVKGILTPEEMRHKIGANAHRIDPIYLVASQTDSAHFADLAPECPSGTTHTAPRPDDEELPSNHASLGTNGHARVPVCVEKGSIPVQNVQDVWHTTGGAG